MVVYTSLKACQNKIPKLSKDAMPIHPIKHVEYGKSVKIEILYLHKLHHYHHPHTQHGLISLSKLVSTVLDLTVKLRLYFGVSWSEIQRVHCMSKANSQFNL